MFIPVSKIRKDRVTAYRNILYDYKVFKEETHLTRLTVGGENIYYSFKVATSSADVTTFKFLVY